MVSQAALSKASAANAVAGSICPPLVAPLWSCVPSLCTWSVGAASVSEPIVLAVDVPFAAMFPTVVETAAPLAAFSVHVGDACVFVFWYSFVFVVSISRSPGSAIFAKVPDVPSDGVPAFRHTRRSEPAIIFGLSLVPLIVSSYIWREGVGLSPAAPLRFSRFP